MGRKTKPTKAEKKRAGANRRMLRNYGRTVDWYDKQLAVQGGGCAICGGTPRPRVRYTARIGDVKAYGKTKQLALTRLHKALGHKRPYGPFLGQPRIKKLVIVPRLHVDHSHKFSYFKVKAVKTRRGKWKAWMPKLPNIKPQFAQKKSRVVQKVRVLAKAAATRGIICFPCNGGIRKFRDNPRFLAAAAKYLFSHEAECFKENVCQ